MISVEYVGGPRCGQVQAFPCVPALRLELANGHLVRVEALGDGRFRALEKSIDMGVDVYERIGKEERGETVYYTYFYKGKRSG
jgi:hypothetical protein